MMEVASCEGACKYVYGDRLKGGPWVARSRPLAARGSQEAGFTQPRDHLIAHLCTWWLEIALCMRVFSLILRKVRKWQTERRTTGTTVIPKKLTMMYVFR